MEESLLPVRSGLAPPERTNHDASWQSLDPSGRYDQCARWLMTFPSEFEHWTGKELIGYTIKKKPDEWLLTVKARKGDKEMVAFLSGGSPFECYFTLAVLIKQRDGLKWRPSLY